MDFTLQMCPFSSDCMAVKDVILAHTSIVSPEKGDDQKLDPSTRSGLCMVTPRRRKEDEYYCERDLTKTIETISVLCLGCFYFPEVSSAEAKQMLKCCSVGTFFVRDSSDPRYLYTISVKTMRGPTSIRIMYDNGRFALDSDEKSRKKIPKFTSVLDLIDYYMRLTYGKKSEPCRFLDRSGKKDLPIIMSKPKLSSAPSLKHLCRTTINRSFPAKCAEEVRKTVDELTVLPRPLRSYLKDYPYLY